MCKMHSKIPKNMQNFVVKYVDLKLKKTCKTYINMVK